MILGWLLYDRFHWLNLSLIDQLGQFSQYIITGRFQQYAANPMLMLSGLTRGDKCFVFTCNARAAGVFQETWTIRDLTFNEYRDTSQEDLLEQYAAAGGASLPKLSKCRNARHWTFRNLWVDTIDHQFEWHFPPHLSQRTSDIEVQTFFNDFNRTVDRLTQQVR